MLGVNLNKFGWGPLGDASLQIAGSLGSNQNGIRQEECFFLHTQF